jgi:hypothetical protein
MPKLEEKIGVLGSCDDNNVVRLIVAEAIKASGKKREQIADEMTLRSGVRVSASMLNDYSAESKSDHRFPFLLARAFCEVTNDWRLFTDILNRSGKFLIDQWEKPVLELGERLVAQRLNERDADDLCEQIVRARRAGA